MKNLQQRIDSFIRTQALKELPANPSEADISEKIEEMIDAAVDQYFGNAEKPL